MQTRRDQLQAYQFVQGRVVSALLRAEPDAPETPTRRFRVGTLAGAVIAALAVGGAIVWGLLSPGGAKGWRKPGTLIVVKETGTRYVLVDDVLHPVLNFASARLLLGGKPKLVSVSQRSLHGVPHGAPVGIPGAPDALPRAAAAGVSVWFVCSVTGVDDVGGRRTGLALSVDPPASRPGSDPAGGGDAGLTAMPNSEALLVRDPAGVSYLVSRGQRLRLADDGVQRALGYAANSAYPVPTTWLNALPAGSDLVAPPVPGRGEPGPMVGGTQTAIGEIVTVRNPGTGADEYYLALGDGLAPLSPLGAALLLSDPASTAAYPGRPVTATPLDFSSVATVARSATRLLPPDWPVSPPPLMSATMGGPSGAAGAAGATSPCVRQRMTADRPEPPDLVLVPSGSLAGRTPPGDGSTTVVVPPGGGLLVRDLPAAGGGGGTRYLVTDLGVRFPLPGDDAVAKLGYADTTPLPVPSLLLSLLPTGPSLDPGAAEMLSPVPVPSAPPTT